MPCVRINAPGIRGFVCLGNEPVEVRHNGKTYLFEWTSAGGWMACNKDGSQRVLGVPSAVWEKVSQMPRGE